MKQNVTSERKLTNRQREFSKLFVQGIYSNAECARRAGFSPDRAQEHASRLINFLRQSMQKKYDLLLVG